MQNQQKSVNNERLQQSSPRQPENSLAICLWSPIKAFRDTNYLLYKIDSILNNADELRKFTRLHKEWNRKLQNVWAYLSIWH